MYRGFCVVVNGHISFPLPCHTTFHVLLKGMLVVSHVCVSLLCCCPPGCCVSGCAPSPQVGSFRPSACPPASSLPAAVLRDQASWVPFLVIGFCFLHGSPLPSLVDPEASMEIWGFAQGCRTIKASSCSLTDPASTLLSWPGPQIPAACPPSSICTVLESWVERANMMVGPGSGQGEELGHPQCIPGGSSLVEEGQPVLGLVPRSRQGLPGRHPPAHPRTPACACFAPPLLGPRCLHCLPFCLHLLSSPTPAHVEARPPGCELLGGRPSINVKCCCPPLLSGLCLPHPAQQELSPASEPKHLPTPWAASLTPARAQTAGAATRVVFIRRLLG